MTMGGMIACSILGGRVLGPVGQAVSHLVQYESVAQSMKMIDSFWAIPEQRSKGVNYVYPDVRPSRISLQNLEFQYSEEGQKILNINNVEFNQGERIALLGNIGSGKSTLLKVLAGLYKPTSGRIRMGDADLWELEPEYISKNVGYLPQSPELFKGTLKSNLTLGRSIGDTKILSVVNLLGLDAIADQSEKGLDLPISEGGIGLSGGQKQLVAIARLFVGNASVWILDEPTASLDPTTQAAVVKAIQVRMRPTDILFFATHNPKLAMDLATRVIVMNQGQITNDAPVSAVQLRSKNVKEARFG
jgi:ATP-binding cassette subfamily C protein LapB